MNRSILAGLFLLLAPPAQAEELGLHPRLVVREPVFEGEGFRPGAPLTHEFTLHNEGEAPLLIGEIRTGCSCAVADHDQVIAPGGQGRVRITVEIYREWAGLEINRTVWLITNDPESAQVSLTVRGRVAEAETANENYQF